MALPLADLTPVVLAGGRSTRFGRDKGCAEWRGRRLIDHVLDRLDGCGATPVVVLRAEQEQEIPPDVTVVHDDPARPEGPLRGVIQGLAACRTDWAWIVACDQPLVCPALVVALRAAVSSSDLALIPEWEGRLQPLAGLYATTAGPLLAAQAAAGQRSLIGGLKTIGFRVFDQDECRRVDPRGAGFLNVNRPEHLDQLEGFAP
jgi:molybdopterin-guanine dinucleotide biosynthesis protein A